MEANTPKKSPKDNLRPPWKPGESGNPQGRPKGRLNKTTIFLIALKEVAEALRFGKEPDRVKIELVKRGFREGLAGNYPFWHKMMILLGLAEEDIAKVSGKIEVEIEQKIRTDPAFKKAVKIYNEEIKKQYRTTRDNRRKHIGLDKK